MNAFDPFPLDHDSTDVRLTRISLDRLEAPDFQLVFDLWRRKRGSKRAPARSDFDPMAEMRPALPRLMLLDVLRDPPDFRYRLAGTETFFVHGAELTGKSVLDLMPVRQGQIIWNELCQLVKSWEPQHARFEFVNQEGNPRSYAVLRLPLSSDGDLIDMVMVVQDFGLNPREMQAYYSAVRKVAG
jgi:hypothetical protein